MLAREGQHIGVVTNAFTKSAPSWRRILLVFFITSGDPSAVSKSSVIIKTMLGRLADPEPLRKVCFGLRAADMELHNMSSVKIAKPFIIFHQIRDSNGEESIA